MSVFIIVGVSLIVLGVYCYALYKEKYKLVCCSIGTVLLLWSWVVIGSIVAYNRVDHYEYVESKYIKELNKNCYVYKDKVYSVEKLGLIKIAVYNNYGCGLYFEKSRDSVHNIE